MSKELTAFFSPQSIVLVGASRDPKKVGAIILRNIKTSGYQGKIYPVNPKAEIIDDLKCYPDIKSVPETADLAIISLQAPQILETLIEVGEKGIKNVVVISAGFKEVGEEGEKLEQDLVNIALKYKINLLGPNCLGFVNNLSPLNATFGETSSEKGNLRFISQSGAIATSLFDFFKSHNLGFSEFITLGNKAVLNENDILEYFQSASCPKDNQEGLSAFSPIGMYLESISSGPEFFKIISEVSKVDPIFILKPGKTKDAANAMHSHTGAIAGEDNVFQAVLDQAGVIRCETLEDFFDLAKGFSFENPPLGPKVAVVSNAGGPAVISADAVDLAGLELAEFNESTKQNLAQILPRSASLINPVDVLGDALSGRFIEASEIILKEDGINALVVILTPQVMTEIEKTAEGLGQLSKKYQKPIFCSFIGGSKIAEGEAILNKLKIPTFRFPERAIYTLGKMWQFKKRQEQLESDISKEAEIQPNWDKIKQVLDKAKFKSQKTLDNISADELVTSIGISTPPSSLVSNLDQARKFIEKNNFPIVLKLSSPGLLHKKAVGGVITGISCEDQLEKAWEALRRNIAYLSPEAQKQVDIQIQKQVDSGVEVIIGVKHDPTFGKVLLFGAGGSLAELILDRNLFILPINISDVKKLVEKAKVFSLLKEKNGQFTNILDKLNETIVRLAKLTELIPQIREIEINPLIITFSDVSAVDTKVILEQEKELSKGPQFQSATTLFHQVLAGTLHYFEFETEVPFTFEPGQYLSVKVAEDRLNCYSIAGRDAPNKFNLLVDISPGGPGSKFFDNLKVNDKITYLGPFGTFTLNCSDGAKELLFLGTGCGVAPLKQQIEAALKEKNLKLPIHLYIGINKSKDLFLNDYFTKLSKEYPNFNFKVAAYQPDNNWKGYKGFITDLVRNDFPSTRECAAYLCGNKNMISDVTSLMTERGCSKERIYIEKI